MLNWSFHKEIIAPSAGIHQPIWFLQNYWKCFLIQKKTSRKNSILRRGSYFSIVENAAKFPLTARTCLRETPVLLVSARKRFLALSEHKTFCRPWWKMCGRIAAEFFTGPISSVSAEFPSCQEVTRFQGLMPPVQIPARRFPVTQHKELINQNTISVFTRRREAGAQLEEITADNHQGRCVIVSLLSHC